MHGLQLRSRIHGRYVLGAPWGLAMSCASFPVFYAVLEGACRIECGAHERELHEGDLVFVMPDHPFVLRDASGSRVVPLTEAYAASGITCGGTLVHGGPGARTHLLVGSFEPVGDRALLSRLPALVMAADAPWQRASLELLARETEQQAPGHELRVSRLADALFAQALRDALGGASTEPGLDTVVRRLHAAPERRWSLATMARVAGMSRSIFAERFKRHVGHTPLDYLACVRMEHAAQLLRAGELSTAQVAERVGYETESSFGRAFKRHTGRTPGDVRRAR
jgi:AraC-like DNA-binding protein